MKEAIDKNTVDHLARLARLGLSEEDRQKFSVQLSSILEQFRIMDKIVTDGVEPTTNLQELKNVMAEDEVEKSLSQETVLANTQNSEEGYIKIKKVLEQ